MRTLGEIFSFLIVVATYLVGIALTGLGIGGIVLGTDDDSLTGALSILGASRFCGLRCS